MMITDTKAYKYALYLLDYRDYSYVEMFDKLNKTYDDEDLCYAVVDRLAGTGIINDRRYAEMLAERYVKRKYFGIRRVRAEMQQKGIPGAVIQSVLEPYEGCTQDYLAELIEKKFLRKLTDEKDIKTVTRVKNTLAGYGYGYDEINRGIRDYFKEQDE